MLRGPRPVDLEDGRYFVCIGGAQTFGRFCEKPYPELLQEKINRQGLNFGRGGAGPSFFYKNTDRFYEYINKSRFAVVQVMSGRSESNSLFISQGLGIYTRISNGKSIVSDDAFKQLLEENDTGYVSKIVSETRDNWVINFAELLKKIRVPKILFWFSTRMPDYEEKYDNVQALFGEFPQLVNLNMIRQIRSFCHEYVECVSKRGLPHWLINRFTGKRTSISDPWSGAWKKNWYYPSPEMHVDAANKLESLCKKYI